MNMIFDLNQFYRTPEGNWDPTNAKLILHEAAARNDSVIWQLGNEPNAYSHHFGFELSPKRGARDFQKLNRELKKMFASPALIGPDITRPKHLELSLESGQEEEQDFCQKAEKFLKSFLRHLRVNLTALTWHHYYVNGRTATVDDFISAEVLDQLSWQIPIMADLRDTYASNTPIWLTETSSAWGGGADGLSNTYVAGFLWLDKLGMAAANAIDMVARQKLIYGSYALVDPDFNPYPVSKAEHSKTYSVKERL
ncbi:hypothetical protein SK128_002595 [Halocaridina rubra]|uniref:Uncharacterized protein n=1 Tax=Halocaridina rubra TaxID=373956 RepID=A0AAN8XA87_HALRR